MAPQTVSARMLAETPEAGMMSVYDSLTPCWSGATRSFTVIFRVVKGGALVRLTAGGMSGRWCSVASRAA